MPFFSLQRLFDRARATAGPGRRQRRARLAVEPLEARLTPSSFPQPIGVMLPGQQASSGGPVVFSFAQGNAVNIVDATDTSTESVVLAVTFGTVSIPGPGAGSGVTVSGNGTAQITLSGPVSALQGALDGLTYTPPAHFFGLAYLDVAKTGADLAHDASGFVPIAVNAVGPALDFQSPLVPGSGGLTFALAHANAAAISVSDPIGEARPTVYLQVATGTLSVPATAGLGPIYGNGTSLLGLTGSLAAVNAALDGLQYTPTPLRHGLLEFDALAIDGSQRNAANLQLDIGPGTPAPVIDGPPGLTVSTGPFAFTGDHAIQITGGPTDRSAWTAYVQVAHGTLTVANAAALKSITGQGTNDLVLTGSPAALNAALDGLTFQAAAKPTTDFLNVLALVPYGPSGAAASGAYGLPLTVNATLPPSGALPALTGPAAATTNAAGVTFGVENGNAIAALMTGSVTLQVQAGTLTLADSSGVTVQSGANSLTITAGTRSVTQALDRLHYTPAAGTTSDTLSVTATNANGTASLMVPITTDASTNLAPTLTVLGGQTVSATGILSFTGGTGNALGVADGDADTRGNPSVTTDATLYVVDTSENLATVDVGTDQVHIIGNTGQLLVALAFDPNGNLYGLGFSTLYRIDPHTAATTAVGPITLPGGNAAVSALAFAPDGTLYGKGSDAELYTIDPNTAVATDLGSIGTGTYLGLTFNGGDLYFPSYNFTLVRVTLAPLQATDIGPLDADFIGGMATGANGVLYGVSSSEVYSVRTDTAASTPVADLSGKGLSTVYGSASQQFGEIVTETLTVQSLGGGTLALGDVSQLLSVTGDGSSTLTLTGSVAAINAALDGLRYAPPAGASTDTLHLTISDPGPSGIPVRTATADVGITITP